jgi:glucosamine-6-phosphate deaminase
MLVDTDFRHDLAAFIPYRDAEECRRVRRISREQLCEHPNPDFRIRIVERSEAFYSAFARDLVDRIRAARELDTTFVAILPVGPVPQYRLAAELINRERLSLRHVHTFNMDEYADETGRTAPATWKASFQRAMWEQFFGLLDPDLRPPPSQIHFPTTEELLGYSGRLADLGDADVCYGGIGWCGHIAFWEAHLGQEFGDDWDAFTSQGARLVELHPMTVMQNALHTFGGDWSWVPPKANTIGPRDILAARHRSFWLDGDLGGGLSWQRFIARLVAHGPLTPYVPGSLLQTRRTDYTLLGGVADDVTVNAA